MNTSRLPVWAQPVDILDLLRLSGPIAISRMSMMLMSVTDAIVLGQNAPSELPFILNAWLPMGISLGFGMGILLGVQVLTSELMGVGEAAQSGRIFRRGFWIALALGLGLGLTVYFGAEPLFVWLYETVSPGRDISATMTSGEIARETASATRIMALGMPGFMLSTVAGYYLEALRRPLVVTVVSYIGVMVNVVIDLALVAGWWGIPQMGADGVAWATIGSRTAIMVVLLAAAVWLTPALKPSAAGPADEPTRQVRVGIGTAISNIAEWGGFNFTFVIATWISVVAGTVYGYSVQIMGLAFMFFLGIGTATSVRVAEAFGRGDTEQVRNASRLGVVATLLVGGVLGLIMLVFNDGLAGILVNKDEAIIDGVLLAPIIASLVLYAAIATTFDGLQSVAAMALRAQEIVWVPSAIHVGSFFAIMIPASYILGLEMERGAQGMMEAVILGVFIAGVAQTGLLEWKTARSQKERAAS
jgi:MATE family multidrug resistance protein